MKKSLFPLPFRHAALNGGVFVSNDYGGWLLLSREEFAVFRSGRPPAAGRLRSRLDAAGLLPGSRTLPATAAAYRKLSGAAAAGPSLHILVLTQACNHACVYCRAVGSGQGAGRAGRMTAATAMRSVDMALASPSPEISLEFQGGEALLNWPVLRRAVEYARRRNRAAGKDLIISAVTNFSLMNEEKFAFLTERGVSLCTSLDGPEDIHNANRRYAGGSSYAKTVYWLRRAMRASKGGGRDSLPSALMTTTRLSLPRHDDILDCYRGLGLGGIFLRPLSPIGYAASVWHEIGYEPEEYVAFYRKALDRVLAINEGGERFVERCAAIAAAKALLGEDPNFLDLRSPCGAAVGQLAYNWDGGVYTCDEGRMAGRGEDDFFRLGEAGCGCAAAAGAPAAKLCAVTSCLDNQPYCSRCAWKQFCGVCPVHNYETQGSPWGNMAASGWCAIQKGVLEAVFSALSGRRGRRIMESWLKPAAGGR